MTEAETEFCRGGLSAGTVVRGRPHQPQQPCLPGSAESAADIKLSWWRGVLGQQGLNTPVVAQWSTHLPARWKTEARAPAIANAASCPRQHAELYCRFQKLSYPRSYSGQYFRLSRGRPGLNSRPRRMMALLAVPAGVVADSLPWPSQHHADRA